MAAPMFEVLYTVTADGNVPVTKYRSKRTGLSVFIAQVEGPLVNGYFCLGIKNDTDKNLQPVSYLVFVTRLLPKCFFYTAGIDMRRTFFQNIVVLGQSEHRKDHKNCLSYEHLA